MKEKVIQMWHLQLNFYFEMKVLLYFKRNIISEYIFLNSKSKILNLLEKNFLRFFYSYLEQKLD